ncbi:MAG: hypothetical protein Q7T11_04645 [Deltaproteobacteria bacterium]|nr:hypothetical protein [Deltaproteobacteria bacterium]
MVRLKDLLNALVREKTEMIIVGGLAGIMHGASYITNDLDICYRRSKENYQSIVKALRPFKPALRGPAGEGIPFLFDEKTLHNGLNFTLKTEAGDIDILGELTGIGTYENLLPNVETMPLFGMSLQVISLDDLIRAKKNAGRTKDKIHVDILEALKKMNA